MFVMIIVFIVLAYGVKDARNEDYCKLDNNARVQYCFDPGYINGLRRCNSYEPADVILRPGCNAPNHSNHSLTPMRCVDGKWTDIDICTSRVQNTGPQCTWKGIQGKCVNKYRCLMSAAENLFKTELPPTCGKGNERMICCTDCLLVDDTRQILFNTRLGLLYKNGGKAHDKCIDYINELDYPCSINGEKRIEWVLDDEKKCYNAFEHDSGGNLNPSEESITNSEFSHVALIGFGSDVLSLTSVRDTWLCSGSLISHNFILTAAHCANSRIEGPATFVALGIERLTDPPEQWRRYIVKNVILHPDYDQLSKLNDIALLETDTPVSFKGVRPACLHVDGDPDDKATAVASGSVLRSNNLGETLLSVNQDKYSDEECLLNYLPGSYTKNGYDSTTQLCYGDRMGILDTDIGDFGGPLHSREHYPGRCVFTILGVLSSKRFTEHPRSIYTRVQYYVPWIESVVWP